MKVRSLPAEHTRHTLILLTCSSFNMPSSIFRSLSASINTSAESLAYSIRHPQRLAIRPRSCGLKSDLCPSVSLPGDHFRMIFSCSMRGTPPLGFKVCILDLVQAAGVKLGWVPLIRAMSTSSSNSGPRFLFTEIDPLIDFRREANESSSPGNTRRVKTLPPSN